MLLALLVVLLTEPAVLLLDEPTNNLDRAARRRLYRVVELEQARITLDRRTRYGRKMREDPREPKVVMVLRENGLTRWLELTETGLHDISRSEW